MVQEKVAFITGGGSGLGAAAGKLLAEQGAKVALVGHTEDEIKKVAQEIEGAGGEALALVADISDGEALKRAYRETVDRFGGLDIVFANAGINGTWAPLDELSEADFRQTVEVNLTGTFLTLKYALPYMKDRGGSMIVTSSVNGTRIFSNSGATAYSSTKAAQVAMTKMLAVELGKYRIRVNAICPGAIETNIDENTEQVNTDKAKVPVEFPEGEIPLTDGEPGASEQVAQLVLFLGSAASNHISGTEVWIDGAQSLLQG